MPQEINERSLADELAPLDELVSNPDVNEEEADEVDLSAGQAGVSGSNETTETTESKTEDNDKVDLSAGQAGLPAKQAGESPDHGNEIDEILKSLNVNDVNQALLKLRDSKRTTDNNFTQTNQKAKELEKELSGIKSELEERQRIIDEYKRKEVDLDDGQFESRIKQLMEDDPEKGYLEALKQVRKEFRTLLSTSKPETSETEIRKAVFRAEQAKFARKHKDYNDVCQALIGACQNDPDLNDKVIEARDDLDVERIYELGKPYNDAAILAKDPESYRQRIIDEYEASRNNGNGSGRPKPLSDIPSKTESKPKGKQPEWETPEDVVSAVFNF